MIVDSEVLIWLLRGSRKAAQAIDEAEGKAVSVVTYMELVRRSRDEDEMRIIKALLSDLKFRTLPLSENVGHRATIYLEEYGLSSEMTLSDALLAATAVEVGEPLLTTNPGRFKAIKELETKVFKP